MVLHTTFAGLKLGTTGGTTYDSVSSTGFYPTGDSEVQLRGGGLPRLIGYDNVSSEIIQIGAVTDYDHFQIGMNTWPSADYIKSHVMKTTGGAAAKYGHFIGDGQPRWMLPGRALDQDADWDIRVNSTTASMTNVVALYLQYGNAFPYKGGDIITRMVDWAADDGAYPATGTDETITDLDPRVMYRVAGLQLGNVEDHDHISLSVTSSSNNTRVGAVFGAWTATTFHPNTIPVWFPHDSILVSGVETVTVSSSSDVAQRPTAYIYFEKYGSSGTAQSSAQQSVIGGGSGGRIGGGTLTGKTSNFGSGIFSIGR